MVWMMQASIQIQGPGSTPFDANNQNLVVNAFAAVMTTVTRADFLVRYFTSDDSKIPSFGTSSRKLLVSLLLIIFSADVQKVKTLAADECRQS